MIRINLLGETKDNVVAHTLQLIGAGAVCVLMMFGCFIHYQSTTSTLELALNEKSLLNVQVEKLRAKTKKVEDLEKNKKLLREKLMTIARLKAKKHGPVHVMNDITQAIPRAAWITAISQKSDALEFQGFAVDPQTISTFMRSLELSPYFASVDLLDSRLSPKDGVPVQKFTLSVRLRNALDVKKLIAEKQAAEKPQSAPAATADASAPAAAAPGEQPAATTGAAPAAQKKDGSHPV